MLKHISLVSCILFFIHLHPFADTTFTSTRLGYKSYLPDNWICEPTDSAQDYFYDTTGTYGALLSIVRYPMDTNMYPNSEEWTISHYIAYIMYMDYYPFGTVLFSDSSATEKQGDLQATEIYLRFYTDDTLDYAWDEYIRYTATKNYGYELYAIGDTNDMSQNIGLYGAILKIIEINENLTPIVVDKIQPEKSLHVIKSLYRLSNLSRALYTVQGRRVSTDVLQNNRVSQGIYIYNKQKLITVPSGK